MRLILQLQQTDGCTYHCTDTIPVEYESAEALLVDLMEAAEKALCGSRQLTFLGRELNVESFFERSTEHLSRRLKGTRYVQAYGGHWLPTPPTIMTVDEWFASSDALRAA